MFKEEFTAVGKAAQGKVALLKKNPLGYFLLSMLAGSFIGFGVLLTNTIGGYLNGSPFTKMILGMAFGIALSLVVMAGAELFTGNNLVMTAGILKKNITLGDAVKLWCVCWVGNLAGSILLGIVYHFTELGNGVVGEFMANAALGKMSAGPAALIARGMLCNMLVCIATWCGTKLKSEAGKLIMIFWCLFAFITTGFEHSIANMTLFAVTLLRPSGVAVTFGGAAYNLIVVTIGNMIGGILFVALPYYAASKEK
ncbi:MAG: formate/nitrite transporter family protein [Eubacteriales bacterium]|nr:formate/nitrite transporter family protein [Eubacteriales bacterium]